MISFILFKAVGKIIEFSKIVVGIPYLESEIPNKIPYFYLKF